MRYRFGRIAFAITGVAIWASATWADVPKPGRDDIAAFRDRGLSIDINRMPLFYQWQIDLRNALKSGSVASAAKTLAPRYGLDVAPMQRLIELVLVQQKLAYPRDEAARAAQREYDAALAALVRETRQNPLLLDAAAAILAPYGKCDPAVYDDVIANAADPVGAGWHLVRAAECPDWQYTFLKRAGSKNFGPLVEIVQYTGLMQPAQYLALYEHLAGPEALAVVDPADRDLTRSHLSYELIGLMWDLGLTKQGIAFFESLPAEIQALLLGGVLDGHEIHANGLAIKLPAEATSIYIYNGPPERSETSADHFRMLLASAYLVEGRAADAERVFSGIAAMNKMQQWFSCATTRSGEKCEDLYRTAPGYILLDHLLHHSDDDPYLMAEVGLHEDGGLFASLSCRAFPAETFGNICENARMGVVDEIRPSRNWDPADTRAADTAAAVAAALPGFSARVTYWEGMLEAAAAVFGNKSYADARGERRASIDPLPTAFTQLPLPEPYRGKADKSEHPWVKRLAPLPRGYEPVRIERSGDRVVAITVSQTLDPSGEVSPGGFWVHVSNDGGKSWQAPLYTGLSCAFPYVVLPQSKLPLIDGDTLNVAVDIQLIDTASISYPPVAMQTRAHQTGLYLRIPLADLRRDSDGDGITDITEAHLLLDPRNPDSDGDGIPDGRDRMPNVKLAAGLTAEQQAVQLLLEKLFSIPTGAIIQRPDQADGEEAILAAGTSATKNDPNPVTRPIFVGGDKADFAGLNPGRMMLVYSPLDIEKLQRMTVDFHAVSFGKIIFNRAHTRGFFSYSSGWSGGTVRLVRVDGGWKLEEISSWIS